jgi:hypothetical protein
MSSKPALGPHPTSYPTGMYVCKRGGPQKPALAPRPLKSYCSLSNVYGGYFLGGKAAEAPDGADSRTIFLLEADSER